MGKMKKLLTWARLLNKRLFRRPTFLAILLLIPVLVFCYGLAAQEESGVCTVVLAQEGADALADQVIEEMLGSSQLILFKRCDSPEEAVSMVEHGKADAAWIFPEDLAERIETFVADPNEDNAFIRVVQREESVLLQVTREILIENIYEYCAERVFLHYTRATLPELADWTEEELLELYYNTDLSGDLFVYEQTDGTRVDTQDSASYLLTPVRGLLGVVIVLCGLATAMYYTQDRIKGTFAWLPVRMLPAAELGCQLVSVVDVALAALLSLAAVGMAGKWWQELLLLVLYSLSVAVFSMLLRRLCGSIRALGTLMPLLVVVMLLVCPVFFDLGALRQLQYLFPPTYYINGVYSSRYLLYLPAYTAACGSLYWVTGKLLKRI